MKCLSERAGEGGGPSTCDEDLFYIVDIEVGRLYGVGHELDMPAIIFVQLVELPLRIVILARGCTVVLRDHLLGQGPSTWS